MIYQFYLLAKPCQLLGWNKLVKYNQSKDIFEGTSKMSFSLLKIDHRNMKARISVWKFGFDQSNNIQKFEVAEGEYLLITLCIQWMLKHSPFPRFSLLNLKFPCAFCWWWNCFLPNLQRFVPIKWQYHSHRNFATIANFL